MEKQETEYYRELLETAKQVDHLCDDFERAWLGGSRPKIEAYLDGIGASERPSLLKELLQVELDAQLAQGVHPDRDQYVQRFPECAALIDQVLNQDAFKALSGTSKRTAEAAPLTDTIAGFRIVKELSRGGQAVVYQAIQHSTKRKVALKVMLEGPFAGGGHKRRFEREIELIGSLRHPGIVPIYDSGVSDGRCYYAMEYVRGQTLTRSVQSRKLDPRDVLRLFSRVCDAVDYAHQRGVIHRDLKPSNVLVDDRGDPHVLDFGLAKIAGAEGTAQSLISVTGQIVGTPAYMSPEQAAGRPDEVDMRSDVYALGVILYELLTGQPPYDVTGSLGDVLNKIQETQPKRPSLTGTHVNSEVETIVLKALDKDKQRRYDTAGALGRDIGRFLAGEPIEAKRDSALYVLRKTLRRYRAAAAVAATFIVVITASAVALSFLYYRAESNAHTATIAQRTAEQAAASEAAARERANQEAKRAREAARNEAIARDDTRQELYVSDMNSAAEAWENSDLVRMFDALDRHRPAANQEDLRGFEWYYLWQRYHSASRHVSLPHDDEVTGVVFSPDGKSLVTATLHSTIRLWNIATREGLVIGHSSQGKCMRLAISPDGKTLASGHWDGSVILWDSATHRQRTLNAAGGLIQGLAFSSDSRRLAATGFGSSRLKLWDVGSGNDIDPPPIMKGHGLSVAMSRDSNMLAIGTYGRVHLWDLDNPLKSHASIRDDKTSVRCVVFSPNGKLLAMGGDESVARLFDLAQNRVRSVLGGHLAPVYCGAFSPDGSVFATGGADRTVRLWDVETGLETAVLRGHTGQVRCLAFSPDGTILASGSTDHRVILWNTGRPEPDRLQLHQSPVDSLAFSFDGTKLATVARAAPSLVLWDVASGRGEVLTEGDVWIQSVAISPTDNILVAHNGRHYKIWDLNTRTAIESEPQNGIISSMAFSPDGKTLVSTTLWIARVLDTETWRQVRLEKTIDGPPWWTTNVAFSPSGGLFATPIGLPNRDEHEYNAVRLYDTNSWEKVRDMGEHDLPVHDVAFSPVERTLASACQDGTVELWDLATFDKIDTLTGETSGVYCVAFSPDGKTLVSGGVDSRINIWNLKLKRPKLVATLRGHTSSIRRVVFSPDGEILATASYDGTVRLWRAGHGVEQEVAESE